VLAEERAAEREMLQEETAPMLAEIKALRAEIASLRARIEERIPVANAAGRA
jgi:peptidoglycan hydrolase CwlO-like protein